MEISVKCFVCEEIPKYTCPRCSIHYCSVDCYKHEKHLQCSEAFYKEQVIAELKDMKGSPRGKRKMMEMLLRQQKVANAEGDKEISERLSDVHLDDIDTLWERLNAHEKLMFQERLRKGNVDFLKLWKPWWEESNPSSKKIPRLPKDLPALAALTNGKQPSVALKYNALEVILAYACVMRVFNGDLYDMASEASELFLNLTNVLRHGYVYSDLETCLLTFIGNVEVERTAAKLNIDPFQVCIHQDLRHILISSDRQFVVRCMCDLYERLKKLSKILKSYEQKNNELISTVRGAVKKVYFFVVYCNEYEADIKKEEIHLTNFCQTRISYREEFADQREDIDNHMDKLKPKGSRLIEEL